MKKKKQYIMPEVQLLKMETAYILAGSGEDDNPGELYDQIEMDDDEYCDNPD